MSQKIINLEIVTPESVVSRKAARQITVPTTTGEITVLPDHIPLISVLQPGVIELKKGDGSQEIIAVSGGFIEVLKDKVVILADTAERAEELDEERIKLAQERARDLKKNAKAVDDIQFAAVEAKLEKELARGQALRRWRRLKGDIHN